MVGFFKIDVDGLPPGNDHAQVVGFPVDVSKKGIDIDEQLVFLTLEVKSETGVEFCVIATFTLSIQIRVPYPDLFLKRIVTLGFPI